MREIKFRAVRNGVMYDGLPLDELLSMASQSGFELNAPTPVKWMQSTGLQDKNGVDIYEGDILEDDENFSVFPVVWNSKILTFTGDGEWLCDWDGMVKIIGNVHENKELLK